VRRGILLGTAVALLVFAAAALALTAGEFEPRANEWQAKACTPTTLASKKTKAGQEIALCYALKEVQAHKANIQSLSLDSADLRSKVASLEADTPPLDFTFFANEAGNTAIASPVADVGRYRSFSLSTQVGSGCLNNPENHCGYPIVTLEWSNDQVHWIGERVEDRRAELHTVGGRYYRVNINPSYLYPGHEPFPYEVTAIAHFTT